MTTDSDENRENAAPHLSVPPLDADKYREYVEDFDLPEERKIELLKTLWWIMAAFVDLGFGVDSVQRLLPALNDAKDESEADDTPKKKP